MGRRKSQARTEGGTRTLTPLRTADFETAAGDELRRKPRKKPSGQYGTKRNTTPLPHPLPHPGREPISFVDYEIVTEVRVGVESPRGRRAA